MLRLKVMLGGICSVLLIAAVSCSDDDKDDDDDSFSATGGQAGFGAGSGGTGSGGVNGDAGTTGAGASSGNAGNGGNGGTMMCETLEGLVDCGGQTVGSSFKPVNLLLVIDKSGSMTDTVAGGVTKWDALKQALGNALPAVQDRVNVGLEVYPTKEAPEACTEPTGACCSVPQGAAAINVPVATGTESVPAVLAELDTITPGGGTPTASALKQALAYYTVGAGKNLEGDKYVVLATDGGPNCNPNGTCNTAGGADQCTINTDGVCPSAPKNCCETTNGQYYCLDDQNTVAEITALKEAGVHTFVIGIPGTESYATYLNAFAVAGGKPNPSGPPEYYAVSAESGVQGLTDVFVDITTKLIQSCEIELNETPPNPMEVNVALDCEVIPKMAANGSGWDLDTESTPAKIVLKGPVCNFVETNGVNQVNVVFGCPTIEIR